MPENKVCFADFELDFARFQLCRSGQPVRLEGLPLQLLMFLVEHQGQLVTREQIASSLWGKDVFVDVEQGINTAIRKIRMALADDSAQPKYLQTVVGRGIPLRRSPWGIAAQRGKHIFCRRIGTGCHGGSRLGTGRSERPPQRADRLLAAEARAKNGTASCAGTFSPLKRPAGSVREDFRVPGASCFCSQPSAPSNAIPICPRL